MCVLSRLALLSVLALASPIASAQSPDDPKEAVERSPEMDAAETVALAAALAAHGRRTGTAQALVSAASLLLDTPVTVGLLPGDEAVPEDSLPSLFPADLLDEALALLPDADGTLAALITELRVRAPTAPPPPVRGAEKGPLRYAFAVKRDDQREHTIRFRGRETATIHLIGDGSSDLDFFLYDVSGTLVAHDRGSSDTATLFWNVPYRQDLKLVVRNRGKAGNRYHVVTN